MSGHGAPTMPTPTATGSKIAIIASQWHTRVMDGLIAGAARACAEAGVEPMLVRVPGSFELPVAAARLARARVDAIVALGVVIRGGTPHFDYVCSATTSGLTDVAVSTGVPVGFGLLTCDTDEQALDRAGLAGSSEDKGFEAAQAAIATTVTLRQLGA